MQAQLESFKYIVESAEEEEQDTTCQLREKIPGIWHFSFVPPPYSPSLSARLKDRGDTLKSFKCVWVGLAPLTDRHPLY